MPNLQLNKKISLNIINVLTSYKCLRKMINMSLLTVTFWMLIITDFKHNYKKGSFM